MAALRNFPTGDGRIVLRLLLDGKPRTRVQLAAETGWARNTVVARLNELVEHGWVHSTDSEGQRGRPATVYSLNRRAGYLFVADFGQRCLRATVTDLLGQPVAAEHVDFNIEQGPEDAVQAAQKLMSALLDRAGLDAEAIMAAAIVLPSPLDHSTGRPVNPSAMPGWTHFDVAAGFAARLGVPTCADNDANAMAAGARRLVEPGCKNLVFVNVQIGVGIGVISGGVLQRGSRGLAGEIGHIPVAKAAGRLCSCGNVGCVGVITSGAAIVEDLAASGLDVKTMGDVMELSGRGNREVLQTLREAGRSLGEVLVAVTATLSPSVIVIGGEATVGDHLASGVREVIFAHSVPALVSHLRIVTTPLHEECAINGGAELALEVLIGRTATLPTGAVAAGNDGELLQAIPA